MPKLDHRWSCSCAGSKADQHPSSATAWLVPKVEEMLTLLTSILTVLYGSLANTHTLNLIRRGVVLFLVGAFFALVLNLLQIQRHVALFPEEVVSSLFSSAWWVPPCCGTAAAVVGLLYPCIDSHLGEPHKFKREWASVMRCIAVFVGINHASAKLDFANNVQLSLTLAALSLGLWWTFDRSRSGFGLGITIAILATLITQLLVYNGIYQYTSPDFIYIRSWLPCIFFSGGVTVGNIGRQLAMGVPEKSHKD
ncbi:insulin-induced gene 1 protein isoform X2 [Latimeria chalumnae]|uniref:Insulin-induced gene protein n=2 Tax=Latimeria chalumnae TaxID=7897 RepID=M3XID4_LATCH|nr:PREDICTED: insulin-induced gene 1 protein-like isoform X2 [Latimeria chalumnae]XP_014351072.1 PREDICTED: insulin-induced gene 1 protein-like isoform X2 [Latimeria chalumnae]|eukprot:XP_006007714.1 PREDICTED: insulin-induced gene 1 protein-like isoform X2 [Latimeria chalumnae]